MIVAAMSALLTESGHDPGYRQNRLDFGPKARIGVVTGRRFDTPPLYIGLASQFAGLRVVRTSISTPRATGAPQYVHNRYRDVRQVEAHGNSACRQQ